MLLRKPLPVLALLALAAAAAAAVLWLTRHGVGISNDSSLYLGAAESVLRGRGLRMPFGYEGPAPLTHFPPLYPLVLAAGGALGAERLAFARMLGAALFAANVALAGVALRRYAPARPGAALTAAFLTLASLDLLYVHGMVWSEPPYLVLATGGLLLAAEHLRRPSPRLLAAAAVACGLAWATRYVGAAVVAAGVLGILLAPSPLPRRRRWRDALVFGAAASLPMAAWLARGAMLSESATNRDLAWHPITRATLVQGVETAANWVLPPGVPGRRWLFVLLAVGFALSVAALLRRDARDGADGEQSRAIPLLLALHLALYGVLLVISISWLDATTPLDFRILAPALSSSIMLAVCVGARLHERLAHRTPGLRAAIPLATVLLAGFFAWRAGAWVARNGGDGQAYASRAWRTSPTVRAVRDLPAGARIHTNLPEAVYLLAGRESRHLPRRRSSLSRIPNPRFRADLSAMGDDACAPSFVVLFGGVERPTLATLAEVAAAVPLRPVATERDGQVFRIGGCTRPGLVHRPPGG